MSGTSAVKEVTSGEADQQKDQIAKALIPQGPDPTHHEEEADYVPVIKGPTAGAEPEERLTAPTPQKGTATDDTKETKVKHEEPTGLGMSLEEFVASTGRAEKKGDGEGRRGGEEGRPGTPRPLLPLVGRGKAWGAVAQEALGQIAHPLGHKGGESEGEGTAGIR